MELLMICNRCGSRLNSYRIFLVSRSGEPTCDYDIIILVLL